MNIIYYTKTDESPLFATYSLLPIFSSFCKSLNIKFDMKDISLSKRILASFCGSSDDLHFLGQITQKSDANIIKLPNISASVVQLKAAIKELQNQGYDIPDFIDNPANDKEKSVKEKYQKILGSAVNPVLREGNSDRRAPKAVKNYAKLNPHFMGEWKQSSKTKVSSMQEGDFYQNETSAILDKNDNLKIVFTCKNGVKTILKDNIEVQKGDIVDSTFMSIKSLKKFIKNEIENTKKDNVLFSIHLKATMMKVSDPVIFGACVEVFFKEVFEKHKNTFSKLNIKSSNGLGDLYKKISSLDTNRQNEIQQDIKHVLEKNPKLAMVDFQKEITNLHVPNNVIIDSSMPLMIRYGGKMTDDKGDMQDVNALIPDRSYAQIYRTVIDDCKKNGAFDVSKMGSVSNVGLMAKKAEEYGSHDKTFIAQDSGSIEIINSKDEIILTCKVEKDDIFRACLTTHEAIINWINLAFNRAKSTNLPTIFWLDEQRAHDKNLKKKVLDYINNLDANNDNIKIMNINEAVKFSLKNIRAGQDVISVTGNVVRDYLTDLFPILELGTSSKMLSIVPLINGGGLFETGAGGTAPMLLEQLFNENHFIWDSLGEFMALFASLEFLANNTNDDKILTLTQTLDIAIEKLLLNNKSPKIACGELDTRGSHFYLAYFWAQELSKQTLSKDLQNKFKPIFNILEENKKKILNDLIKIQGNKVELDGYFNPSDDCLNKIMRPSTTFNQILKKFQ